MTNTIVRTTIKERDDYRFVKVFDKVGNEWATNITSYEAECKHCDWIQIGNPQWDLIKHLKAAHKIEYKD